MWTSLSRTGPLRLLTVLLSLIVIGFASHYVALLATKRRGDHLVRQRVRRSCSVSGHADHSSFARLDNDLDPTSAHHFAAPVRTIDGPHAEPCRELFLTDVTADGRSGFMITRSCFFELFQIGFCYNRRHDSLSSGEFILVSVGAKSPKFGDKFS